MPSPETIGAVGQPIFMHGASGHRQACQRQQCRNPGRKPKPKAEHVRRCVLADLFLDTLPYNAHSTGVDALWAGVPIVTLPGESMPSRVAASAVTNAGLPEMVVESYEEYESLAVALATDPPRLRLLQRRLSDARATAPLFDTARYVRTGVRGVGWARADVAGQVCRWATKEAAGAGGRQGQGVVGGAAGGAPIWTVLIIQPVCLRQRPPPSSLAMTAPSDSLQEFNR